MKDEFKLTWHVRSLHRVIVNIDLHKFEVVFLLVKQRRFGATVTIGLRQIFAIEPFFSFAIGVGLFGVLHKTDDNY